MALSRNQIDALLKSVSMTKSDELTCDECLRELAEFAETTLAGKSIPDSRQAVQQHLAVCGECREEYEALLRALGDEQ